MLANAGLDSVGDALVTRPCDSMDLRAAAGVLFVCLVPDCTDGGGLP